MRPRLAAALALLALLGIFLWKPIAQYPSHTWTTADLLQDYLLTKVTPGHSPGNRLLSDPVMQMLPWTLFTRDSLARGELPLWNPYNACGEPLLANWQSGVFSIFNLPLYVLPLKAGLLVRGASILALLAAFTWLFLREIELSPSAAAVGACAFVFCGHNVLLLAYPHAGGAVALPAGLFFVERAIRAALAGRSVHAACAALAVTLGLSLLAGHPEPVYFGFVLVLVYTLWRLFRERRRVAVPKLLLAFSASALAGLCIGAVQVLPFLEYARNSNVVRVRSVGHVAFSIANWPFWIFPDLLGSPADGVTSRYDVPAPNYEAVNTIHFGATALFTMLVAIVFARKDARVPFFAVVVLAWYLCVHGLFGTQRVLALIPGLSLAPPIRSQVIGAFCTAALAACAIDGLRSASGRWKAAAALLAASVVLILVARDGAARLVEGALASLGERSPAQDGLLARHRLAVTASFLVASCALALIPVMRRAWSQSLAAAAVTCAIFVQTGWNWRGYNSTSADEHVYPATPLSQALQAAVGDSTLVVLAQDKIFPEANILYGLRQVSSYDALSLWPLDNLVQIGFASRDNWRWIQHSSLPLLQYFGVQFVLSLGDWPAVDTLMHSSPPVSPGTGAAPIPVAIDPGRVLVQEFVFDRPGLCAVMVQLGARSTPIHGELVVALEDVESGETLASVEVDSHAFLSDFDKSDRVIFPSEPHFGAPTRPLVLAFDPLLDSAMRRYRIRMTCSEGEAGRSFCGWRTQIPAKSAVGTTLDGQELPGRLLFDASAVLGTELVKEADLAAFRLWRLASGRGRAWIVHTKRAFHLEKDSLGKVLSGSLSPYKGVVLIGDERGNKPVGTPSEQDHLETLEDAPRRMSYAVNTADGGYLVLALPWYPGWKASIDGAPAELERANYAFQAVRLPPGAHRVALEYRPASVRIGAWCSALGALACAIWAALGLRSAPRPASAP